MSTVKKLNTTKSKKVLHCVRILSLALQFVRKCEYKGRDRGNKNKENLVLFIEIATNCIVKDKVVCCEK